MKSKDTVLCKMYSESWGQEMKAILVEYENGTRDLFTQTGGHFDKLKKLAEEALLKMGLRINESGLKTTCPSGVYMEVEAIAQ